MVDFSKLSENIAERARERRERAGVTVFTGSRDWQDARPVRAVLQRLQAAGYGRVAHGAARGLDRIVDTEGVPLFGRDGVAQHPADWTGHGKRAGIERNYTMVLREEPHLGIAFPCAKSVGTWHCAVLLGNHCPTLVYLGGVRDVIDQFARECNIDPARNRPAAVCAFLDEQVRKQVGRSGGALSFPRVSMPDPSKAWGLLAPRDEVDDPRSRAGLDALVGVEWFRGVRS